MNAKNTLRTAGFATMLAIAAPAFALAQGASSTTPANAQGGLVAGQAHTHMSKSEIESELKSQGYSGIKDLKQSGNHYTANAERYGQKENNLKISATTGVVMNKSLSKDQVENLLKSKDYSDVHDISKNGQNYTAKVKRDGHNAKVGINAKTGMVIPRS